ncbi:hypothetical protein A5636_05495 [Mycobacterium asiaticum]|uniref:Phosphatidic acid phosphatase type 2/haloperoxidase domain-containing protein n=1 Tax=Mycobacterium asiaticum TaxID=1790 RepID=A0A1A3N0G2_MYCAS|nr:phosphatase PAP2 family protein [Mycobacterium asiaticum]OBK15633.1 hypothetical protein A5636_05495 [Mycobacterium asiaticum]
MALAALVLYAALWVGHRQEWGWLATMDWALLNPAHDIGVKHPGWVRFWVAVSFALGPVPLRIVGFLLAVVLLVRQRVRMALLLLAAAPLNGFLTLVAKQLAGRPRPATALVYVQETSFPSGHALQAMATVLALLTLVLPMLSSRLIRVVAIAVGAMCVFTVGVARVALNVHHPSDVIAGWALGYGYFLLCLWVIRPTPIGPGSRPRDPTGS